MRSLPLPTAVRRILAELVIADRERRGSDFADARPWPERIAGFEDLAFLFSSTILAHGVASLRFDEAAYLYRLVRDLNPRTVVEIGRFRGGSTFLFAAAIEDGVVHSYDLETRQGRAGADLDRELVEALRRYGLEERVRLITADSRTADPPGAEIDLLFIDGDHRETGVRADFERWAPWLSPRGHLLFHDAVAAPDLVPTNETGPARVAAQTGEEWEGRAGAGSLAHFTRRI